MSKKVVDTPIYVDTYKLVGIVYGLRFSIPKRDRAVLGDSGVFDGNYGLNATNRVLSVAQLTIGED